MGRDPTWDMNSYSILTAEADYYINAKSQLSSLLTKLN